MVSVYEKGEKILEIFKGTEGPYRIENEGPWGGYTVHPTFNNLKWRYISPCATLS